MPGDAVRDVRLLQPRDLIRTELELLRSKRVVDMLRLRRADDRCRHSRLVEQPGERDLRGWDAPVSGDLREAIDDRKVGVRGIEGIAERVGPGAHRQALALACAVAREQPAG